MPLLRMRIAHIEQETPSIRRLFLEPLDEAAALPPFEAGAHVAIRVPLTGEQSRRAYSLVNATGPFNHFEIAVQLEADGSGGSKWLHSLAPGYELDVEEPRNHFALAPEATRSILIAGGIGITPILSMARVLGESQQPFDLHYAARTSSTMAYRSEISAMPNAQCWFDDGERTKGIPIEKVIGAPQPSTHIYVCGPGGLIDAVHRSASTLGWNDSQVHSERFILAKTSASALERFEVHVPSTRQTFVVEPDQSILDTLIAHGLDPLFDCKRGDCGVCVTRVLEGEPEHRDICLSADDRRDGLFCPCVSRSRSARIVIDL